MKVKIHESFPLPDDIQAGHLFELALESISHTRNGMLLLSLDASLAGAGPFHVLVVLARGTQAGRLRKWFSDESRDAVPLPSAKPM